MTLRLFEGFGIELEYMIARADTLDVLPICDELIKAMCGSIESEIERGDVAWSNELVLHVVEFKTNGPAKALAPLPAAFTTAVREANAALETFGAHLLPTAMHPWMNPRTEMRLWPHDYSPVYEAYNRIFGCIGHGWANLQSMHINLPFGDDEEFGRLHAAIRCLLPILPALAASSPIMERNRTGVLCNRMDVYRTNSVKIPSLAGRVVPEPVFNKGDYERDILQRMYRDIAPFDPEGVLQEEFLNSRGAIARFERDAIEIRVLDIQECPRADLAIATLIVDVLRALCENLDSQAVQRAMPTHELEAILLRCIQDGERARIDNASYLALFGLDTAPRTAQELWRHLRNRHMSADAPTPIKAALDHILEHGPLARRILERMGADYRDAHLRDVYADLASCLSHDRLFS